MSVVAETMRSSQDPQHARLRGHRERAAPDRRLQTHSVVQPAREKSTISGLLSSPFSNTNDNAAGLLTEKANRKKTFTSMALSGLGCIMFSQAAEWGASKVRKKKKRKQRRTGGENAAAKMTTLNGAMSPRAGAVFPDICCIPGIGLAASNAAFVDFIEPTRSLPSRGRVSAQRTIHTERGRRRRGNNHDHASGSHISNARRYGDFGHGFSEGLSRSQMGALHRSLMFGEIVGRSDRYGDWRLDVDNMSYEELLDLGERIGYVGTGLREDEILRCLRKMKRLTSDSFPLLSSTGEDWKCSICQEEYEADEDVARLDCGHCYHINCIRQWLQRKNACAVCKAKVAAPNRARIDT